MADKVINNCIDFAYAGINVEDEFQKELEKYFLYQRVLIIDTHFEFADFFEKLRYTRCNFTIMHNISDSVNMETIDAIICVNNHNIDYVKRTCKNLNIPYIIALTNVCDTSIFKPFYYAENGKIDFCNYPLGIILSLSKISEPKKFLSNAILEISNLSFEVLQQNLENLFFNKTIDYDFFETKQRFLKMFQETIEQRKENDMQFVNKIAEMYLSYAIMVAKEPQNFLDNLIYLYKKHYKNYDIVAVKYAFREVVLSLEKDFFAYYNSNLKSAVNYQLHQNYLSDLGYVIKFESKEFPDNKLKFLFDEFRKKLIGFAVQCAEFDVNIKNILADIDVGNLYKMSEKFKTLPITNLICLEPDLYGQDDFLSLIYGLGLLNYDF